MKTRNKLTHGAGRGQESQMQKGSNNHILQEAVDSGLSYKDGRFHLPNGKEFIPHDIGGRKRICIKRKPFLCSRVICWIKNGPPPLPSMEADHIDRNPANDDPSNLRWATVSQQQLNISEETRAQRKALFLSSVDGKRQRGEECSTSRFKEAEVMEIRKQWEAGSTQREIAKRFKTTQSHIQRIVRGHSWKHLPLTNKRTEECLEACRGIASPANAIAAAREALNYLVGYMDETEHATGVVMQCGIEHARAALALLEGVQP